MTELFKRLFIVTVITFLAAPLVVIAGVSFNAQKALHFPPTGFSLRWYGDIVLQKDWFNALTNSIIIAVGAGLLAMSIALPLALFIWRRTTIVSRLLFGLGVAPFMLPPVISALGFLIFWISAGVHGHMATTVVSHGIFLVTLPLVTISLGLEAIDRQLIDAARTMGADSRKIFTTVIFPLVRPYMVSGFAFAFVLSLNEYIIAYMVAGFTAETLPIKIFNSLRYGYTPVMASVSVFFVMVAAAAFGTVAYFGDLPRLLGAERVKEK